MKKLILPFIIGTATWIGIGLAIALYLNHKPAKTVTLYLPDAGHGAQPFCLSNRSTSDIQIPHGPLILPSQTITANVTPDFQWGFSNPAASTDRGDVDCFVIAY